MIVLDAYAWLYQLLTDSADLAELVGDRIFSEVAPATTSYPMVIYAYHNGTDVYGVGKTRVMSQLDFQVKAVGSGASYLPLVPVADLLDTLLHGAAGNTEDVKVLSSIRQSPIAYAEIDEDGGQYRHLGGLYRLQVQPAE